MKEKKIITEDFFIGNLCDIEVTNEIREAYLKTIGNSIEEITRYDSKALVGEHDLKEKIRKCHISWMEVEECNFIENGLRYIIESANDIIWKKELLGHWHGDIQFTKYIGRGEHYSWHKDTGLVKPPAVDRKLSIVYCLSNKTDYVGGEFQIKTSKGQTYITKFDYGDFIVFPSDLVHRVKPLKSGTRITMVGWYL
jgi:PKHD-type hydroxylase